MAMDEERRDAYTLPTLRWVQLMCFLDFFAVSLIIPLLATYFKAAGGSQQQYGLLSSLYSISQLVGGVAIGVLSDNLSKRRILLISFAGSGLSYLLIGFSNVACLFFSRILVGLVKQTMTVCTLLVTDSTKHQPPSSRSQALAQTSSAVSLAFFVGSPLVGVQIT
jgi:DHA1 family tetracycline resistance protein-like MFS transporter